MITSTDSVTNDNKNSDVHATTFHQKISLLEP